MWVGKKKIQEIEKKIAALEKEQLSVMNTISEFMKEERELLITVKELRRDLLGINV